MNIVGIDMGKYKSYVVVEREGKVVREEYVETTKEGITGSLQGVDNPTVVLESCSILDRAVNMLEGYKIVAAHPSQVHMISSSMKKTDKNDAHTLIKLYKAGYLPTSYVPSNPTKQLRDLCRAKRFLVSKRTSIKNKIRDVAFRNGIDFENFNSRTKKELEGSSKLLEVLVDNLDCVSNEIKSLESEIASKCKDNSYAKLLKTIPGIGDYSGLGISSEIGEIERFESEGKICAYAGLVPRIFQSGNIERRGHLIKHCDNFIKYLLIECITIHVNRCGRCFICRDYWETRRRCGTKTARVSAARRMLKTMYYMLKLGQDFDSYLRGRGVRQWNSAAMRPSSDCAPLPPDMQVRLPPCGR
jgi:transposase